VDAVGGRGDAVFALAVCLPAVGAATALAGGRRHGDPMAPEPATTGHDRPASTADLLRATVLPDVGLLLVNIGYVTLVSFGAAATWAHGLALGRLLIPLFAITIVLARTVFAGVPDRFGAARVLTCSALAEAVGLVGVGAGSSAAVVICSVILLSAGQALAVPSLGILALRDVPPAHHGSAAGMFFAWFDAGVGIGGPAVGALASLLGAPTAVGIAGGAVACAAPVGLAGGRLRRTPHSEKPSPAQPAQPRTLV
jgi:hypothetical protein